mmetsp:Transcript_21130/g.51705  ORF Transcript_21130/g.51705 Transcript_21130/m.51705 type:complete len:174 (+) Transcript_21130:120-641(+)
MWTMGQKGQFGRILMMKGLKLWNHHYHIIIRYNLAQLHNSKIIQFETSFRITTSHPDVSAANSASSRLISTSLRNCKLPHGKILSNSMYSSSGFSLTIFGDRKALGPKCFEIPSTSNSSWLAANKTFVRSSQIRVHNALDRESQCTVFGLENSLLGGNRKTPRAFILLCNSEL